MRITHQHIHSVSHSHACVWNWQLCKPCTISPLTPKEAGSSTMGSPCTDGALQLHPSDQSDIHRTSTKPSLDVWPWKRVDVTLEVGELGQVCVIRDSYVSSDHHSSSVHSLNPLTSPVDGSSRRSLCHEHCLGFHQA